MKKKIISLMLVCSCCSMIGCDFESKDKVNRNTKDNTCDIRRISRKQVNNKINS